MLRFASTAVLGFALALPLSAVAGTPLDQKAPESTLVAANEDAVLLPPAAPQRAEASEPAAPKHSSRRGSNQSIAEFRFTNPYAFPVQTLPIVAPNLTSFSGF